MKNKKILTLLLVFVLTISMSGGVYAKDSQDYLDEIESMVNLLMEQYSGEVESGEELTEQMLYEAALTAIADQLDKYTVFYNEVDAKAFIDSLSSQYVGIGVRIMEVSGQVVITEVFEGGAAADADIQINDVINKVNGEDAADYDLNDLVERIVGEEGTYVTIEFIRAGKAFTLELERRSVVVPTVAKVELDGESLGVSDEVLDQIYALDISSFSSDTDEDFAVEIENALAAEADYLLIDLRGNSGGYLETAVNMLEQVVPKGNIVSLFTKEGGETTYTSKLAEVPFQVVVLVDENSASASEIFAAAVKENGQGIIIGETTYGKGVAQNIYQLGEEYLVKVTTQEFFSPDMNKINGVGVVPDVIIDTPEYVNSDRRFFVSDIDEQIVNVEGMLKFLGYFDGEPDDTYTKETYNAVYNFQNDHEDLYAYGTCDFTTQSALNTAYMLAVTEHDDQLQAAVNWIAEDLIKQ